MKLKNFILLAFLLLTQTNVCRSGGVSTDSNNGVISITASHFLNDDRLPSRCQRFFLSIDQYELLPVDNDILIKRHFVGDVTDSIFYFTPSESGRYVIGVVDENNRKDVIEFIYTGGTIAFNLIIL